MSKADLAMDVDAKQMPVTLQKMVNRDACFTNSHASNGITSDKKTRDSQNLTNCGHGAPEQGKSYFVRLEFRI